MLQLLETFKQEHSLSDLLAAKDKQYEELLAKVNAMKGKYARACDWREGWEVPLRVAHLPV